MQRSIEKFLEREFVLPEELLGLVLTRLPWQDIVRLRLVCKNWNSILRDPGFLKACSPAYGVPLLLSSSFPDSGRTFFFSPNDHQCHREARFCPDCDFELFSPQGDSWSMFPRAWFYQFLLQILNQTCTRDVRIMGVKGGIFMIFFRRQTKDTKASLSADGNFPAVHCVPQKSEKKSEIIYLVNPFTQTHRLLDLPHHLKEKGTGLFWSRIKTMVENKQSNMFKILLGPQSRRCRKHDNVCNEWSLDCYNVIEDSWSKIVFHLGSATFGRDNTQRKVVGFVNDATLLGEKLIFIVTHLVSSHSVWEFNLSGSSIFPTRLADIPVSNFKKPSIFEQKGCLLLLGEEQVGDYSVRLWQYDSVSHKWIPIVSIMDKLSRACSHLKGDFGHDLACITVEVWGTNVYFVFDVASGTCRKLLNFSTGRKVYMVEPRLDIEL